MTGNDTRISTRRGARFEKRSAVFKKELGLTDLALTQILFIVGLPWIGVAAKQGPSHVDLWLLAMLLFYIPSAVVVIYLNRIMPLEGGLVPIIQVESRLSFAMKIGGLIVITNVIGLTIFLAAARRRRRRTEEVIIAPAD